MSKKNRLNVRLSDRRYQKLKQYAVERDKTITQVVEEQIDKLKLIKRED